MCEISTKRVVAFVVAVTTCLFVVVNIADRAQAAGMFCSTCRSGLAVEMHEVNHPNRFAGFKTSLPHEQLKKWRELGAPETSTNKEIQPTQSGDDVRVNDDQLEFWRALHPNDLQDGSGSAVQLWKDMSSTERKALWQRIRFQRSSDRVFIAHLNKDELHNAFGDVELPSADDSEKNAFLNAIANGRLFREMIVVANHDPHTIRGLFRRPLTDRKLAIWGSVTVPIILGVLTGIIVPSVIAAESNNG